MIDDDDDGNDRDDSDDDDDDDYYYYYYYDDSQPSIHFLESKHIKNNTSDILQCIHLWRQTGSYHFTHSIQSIEWNKFILQWIIY